MTALLRIFALLALVFPVALPAQAGAQVQPLVESAWAGKGLSLVRQDKKVVQVKWGKRDIPLPAPVDDCVLGLSADGSYLVILGGGVRTSLNILIARGAEDLYSFRTDGGRRLPRPKSESHGSWPWIEGDHLIVFAFEKERKLQCRAVGLGGTVYGSRKLDVANDGWTVESMADGGVVRVRFPLEENPLEFPHPLAPRLEITSGPLDFGTVDLKQSEQRLLNFKNTGKRRLVATFVCEGAEFELKGAARRVLEPGKSAHVVLLFRPTRSGPVERQVNVRATGLVQKLSVVLRGRGKSKAPIVTKRPDGKATSQPVVARKPPLAPRVARLRLYPLGGGQVLLVGKLSKALRVGLHLFVRSAKRKAEAAVDTTGRFSVQLRADPGQHLSAAVVDELGQESGWVGQFRVPELLAVDRDEIVARGLPGQGFLLMLFPKGSDQLLETWRGRLGASGEWRLRRALLPKVKGATELVLVVRGGDRPKVSARVRL